MNWETQEAIVAFVESLRPNFPEYREMYWGSLHQNMRQLSDLLTSWGYPPVA
jgi:hypothetical protein